MEDQMELDIDQAQLMMQLRQMNLKEHSYASLPSPAHSDASSSSSGVRGANDSGIESDKVKSKVNI